MPSLYLQHSSGLLGVVAVVMIGPRITVNGSIGSRYDLLVSVTLSHSSSSSSQVRKSETLLDGLHACNKPSLTSSLTTAALQHSAGGLSSDLGVIVGTPITSLISSGNV